MAELSLDEFSGTQPGSSSAQRKSSLSPAEFAGVGEDPLSPAAMQKENIKRTIFGDAALEKTPSQMALQGLKQLGGEGAALADFVLGLPGFVLGAGAQAGGTIQAAARGVPLTADQRQLNPVTAYTVGRQAGQEFSEPLSNPVQKLLNMFDSGDAYKHAATTKGMEKLMQGVEHAGEWVEHSSGGRISRDSIPMLLDTLMASATGIRGGSDIGKLDPELVKRVRKEANSLATTMREKADNEAAANTLSPEEFAVRAPVQQQINEMLGIRTPQEQAKLIRQRRADVKSAFRSPEEGGDYGSIDESQFRADERLSNEDAYAKESERLRLGGEPYEVGSKERPERIGQAEILKIMQKPGYERTADDLITLRAARKQEGKMDPMVAALMSAAGIGAAVGGQLDDDHLRGAMLGGATAGMPLAMMKMLGAGGVRSNFGQAGAVKGPGGMWHPEAVDRLAAPLKDSLRPNFREAENIPADQLLKDHPAQIWADKAIRNYLNKYAGTERDPLKDVEIPFGENTARWEKLMDNAVGKANKEGLTEDGGFWKTFPGSEKMQPGEQVFNFGDFVGGSGRGSAPAITSYLSHVGDYLRQNVKPEDLHRFDLVRAVKETAAKDEQMKKQMEKSQADSTKSLPVYKEYKDGFKWVELKLPEKLDAEQAKQVRKATSKEIEQISDDLGAAGEGEFVPGRDEAYLAIGPDGKPVHNTYTGELAGGPTPEEAWLAGRLAEEGNTMGHCVGGYCPSVASGESRIFSLRDPKGKSHVTIEVQPANAEKINHNGPPPEDDMPLTQEHMRNTDDIVQIKGKQNRAPNKEYLPYVQDFVKSGKWGEVGDLGNTGLTTKKEVSRLFGSDQAFARRIKETLGDSEYYDKEAIDKLWDTPEGKPKEKGFIDQKLVVGLSSLGLGAAIGGYLSQDKGTGALLGALAGAAVMLPGAKARLKMVADAADYGLGALSTRIGNISPALKLRGREYERNVLTEAHAELHKVVPFMQELEKVGGTKKLELYKAILTNDKERIAQLMQGNASLIAAWRETRNVLNDLGERLQGHGRFKTMLDDYFPRLVKDKDALLAALDVTQRTRLETALADAEKSSMKNRGTPLSDVETSSIINREIQGFRRAKGYQPGFAKQRGVEEVTDKLLPFYFTPAESLFSYIRGAVQDLEMAKFFGKDLQQTKLGGQQHINIEGSVGNLVGSELKAGRIDAKQAEQLIGMLQSRFQGGERASSRLVQEARNLGNMGLIGNVVSAVTQGADTSMAIYSQGFRPFLSAIAKQMTGREKITTADFGLADHIAEEFISRTKTADWLNKMFKYSGFSAIDRFGKNTLLAAAHEKATAQSMTPKGVEQLKVKYGEAFGGDFPRLVSDLKSGKLTPTVRALLFSELSDMQPVSKLEMPQAYLDNPNGRLIYMLKTFMLKQMDVIRRDTYNELKKGNVAKGLYNLTAYGLTLGIAGATTQMVQDWMMGREVKFGATDVLENALKTFGWSAYVRDKAAKGHPMEAVAGMVAPPYKMIDDIVRRDPRAVQYIPLIGKLFYAWELGGKEEAEIRDKRGTERELSERALDYRAKKREAARDKKQ